LEKFDSESITDELIIKEIIKKELFALKHGIEFHKTGEFIVLPESFDYKMGHWNCLMWIISRWFRNSKNINDVPKWYQEIIKLANMKQENRMCENVVNKMLQLL
jgi:hypothetical protein